MTPPPKNLRLLVLDVDGVLTDGGLFYGPGDVELKRFHARDGLAMKAAPAAGLAIAILSARSSVALTRRVAELGVQLVVQGSTDKNRDLRRLLTAAEVAPEHTAYMGDDLADLAPMQRCGYALAPADAAVERPRRRPPRDRRQGRPRGRTRGDRDAAEGDRQVGEGPGRLHRRLTAGGSSSPTM